MRGDARLAWFLAVVVTQLEMQSTRGESVAFEIQ